MDHDEHETPLKVEDECETALETPLELVSEDDRENPLKQMLGDNRETPLKQVRENEDKRKTMNEKVFVNVDPGDRTSACHGMDLDLTVHDWGNPVNQVIIDPSRAQMSDSQPRAMDYFDIMD